MESFFFNGRFLLVFFYLTGPQIKIFGFFKKVPTFEIFPFFVFETFFWVKKIHKKKLKFFPINVKTLKCMVLGLCEKNQLLSFQYLEKFDNFRILTRLIHNIFNCFLYKISAQRLLNLVKTNRLLNII